MITAIGLFSAIVVPPVAREANVTLNCGDKGSNFQYCYETESTADNCTIDRITTLNATDQMKCTSTCKIPPERWHEVCSEWNVESDCTIIKDQVEFDAFIPKNQITFDNNCLNFRIDHALFDNRNSSLTCAINPAYLETSCKTVCDDPEIADVIAYEITVKDASKLYQFWLLFLILIASWAGMAVVVSVGDAICFEMLGKFFFLN